MNNSEVVHGGDVERLQREYGFSLLEVLDYSANINPLPLPQGMREYVAANLDALTRYPDREYFKLRSALSHFTGYDPEWIMVGNGATELIYLAARAFGPAKVLIPAPSFADFTRAFKTQGSTVDFFSLQEQAEFKLNVGSFIAGMSKGYEAIVLCNPNNPTGQLLTKRELLEIVTEAKRQGITVILDETFIEFVDDPTQASMLGDLARFSNLVILRAFTKFFGVPGLRLGYCLGKPELLQKLRILQEPWTVNALASLLGPWLLQQEGYLAQTRLWITNERPFFLARLREIKELKVYEGQANFVLCQLVTEYWNVQGLQKSLEEQGIMIRDAGSFPNLEGKFFRLAIKDHVSNLRVVGELAELLKSKQRG